MNFRLFRLLPGASILVPLDLGVPLDPFELNLFAAKEDRISRSKLRVCSWTTFRIGSRIDTLSRMVSRCCEDRRLRRCSGVASTMQAAPIPIIQMHWRR